MVKGFLYSIKTNSAIIAFVYLGLISCSKEIDYKFQVKNQTKYTLNEVSFGWCNDGGIISVGPYNSTDIFTRTYKVNGLNLMFGPGSLCITVETYSDTISTFKNNSGIALERKQLNKKNLNVIIIQEQQSGNDVFSIDLE